MAVLLSDETYDNLMRIVAKVDAMSGDGVTNDYHNIRIMAQRIATAIVSAPAPVAKRGNFMVNLTQTGGSNGTKVTAASWTYTAKTLDNATTLGTVLTPVRPRPNGTMTAATLGVGYYDNSNTFQLAEAYETAGSGHC